MKKLIVLPALGAGVMFFFDPVSGHRRRKETVDRTLGFVRRRARESARLGRGVAAEVYGVSQRARHRREAPKPQPDDVTLAHKVETEIFRDADVPKGRINVNAEDGVVFLRGEVEQPDLIRDLEEKTRKVQGVRAVENLLHAPGQEAPASG